MPRLTAHPAAHDPITTKVTFAREIRAILSARCVTCHSPRGSAPMPLTTYEEVRPWARAIKEQVLTRRMPKWHAARGYGAFANDPALTPLESALVVSWVDGGLPSGATPESPARIIRADRSEALASAFRRETDQLIAVRPQAASALATPASGWVAGWSVEPGDPLITSATISSAAGALGTWVAGDAPVVLPAGSAMRVSGRIRVEVRRRAAADFEQSVTPRRSLVRLRAATDERPRRVWVEQVPCGSPPSRAGQLLALRPMLDAGASARVWMQRPGAPAALLGWFRDFEPAFARAYWLARPLDLAVDSRLQSDVKCSLELTLAARRCAD